MNSELTVNGSLLTKLVMFMAINYFLLSSVYIYNIKSNILSSFSVKVLMVGQSNRAFIEMIILI